MRAEPVAEKLKTLVRPPNEALHAEKVFADWRGLFVNRRRRTPDLTVRSSMQHDVAHGADMVNEAPPGRQWVHAMVGWGEVERPEQRREPSARDHANPESRAHG